MDSLSALALNDAQIFYLARKVFAYMLFSHGAAVAVLSACLLELEPKPRKVMEEMIANFWIRNYPDDLKLFDGIGEITPELKPSIRILKRHWNSYQKPLRGLQANAAFEPSTLERRIQAEQSKQMQRQIHKQAEQSSLASIFPRSAVLYGRAVITYIYPGGSGMPVRHEMELRPHKISASLPRMDRLCPVHLAYLNFKHRNEKRPS